MSGDLRENLGRGATWLRGLYMLLFAVVFNLAELVLAAVAVFQFLAQLLTGGSNRRLRAFGAHLGEYLRELTDFLAYAEEAKPFPFGPWPGSDAADETEATGPMGPGTEPSPGDSGESTRRDPDAAD